MGRTPDYMNVTFAGFAGERSAWIGADGGNEEGHDNLVAVPEAARTRRHLAHAHPRAPDDQPGDRQRLRRATRCRCTRSATPSTASSCAAARILATLAPFSDEIAVYPGHPLPPDAPPEYALSFSIGMETPGLIFLCRDSASRQDTNRSTIRSRLRFDEQDAFVIFDDVEVPRERVFIDGRPDIYSSVMLPTAWWANIMQQTTLRALTKLEFAYGLAMRMAEAVNDVSPQTIEMLGELSGYVEVTRNAVLLAEEHAYDRGDGVVFPDGRPLHPMRAMLATWFPRVNDILITIGSHNLLATPSRAMLADARLRPLIDEFLHGSNDIDAEEPGRHLPARLGLRRIEPRRAQRPLRAQLPRIGAHEPHGRAHGLRRPRAPEGTRRRDAGRRPRLSSPHGIAGRLSSTRCSKWRSRRREPAAPCSSRA